jgi:predicted ArsR family transcriptional regulator
MVKRDPAPERTEATTEEFKAMAHPLRLRILRLCLHEPLTNKEIADRLGADPATTLHHVRMLLNTGFLAVEEVRTGARGALEKPYRATGKSWVLSVSRPEDQALGGMAILDAVRGELAETHPSDVLECTRLGVKLGPAAAAELRERLAALVADIADRDDDPDGEPYGFFVTFHRQP